MIFAPNPRVIGFDMVSTRFHQNVPKFSSSLQMETLSLFKIYEIREISLNKEVK